MIDKTEAKRINSLGKNATPEELVLLAEYNDARKAAKAAQKAEEAAKYAAWMELAEMVGPEQRAFILANMPVEAPEPVYDWTPLATGQPLTLETEFVQKTLASAVRSAYNKTVTEESAKIGRKDVTIQINNDGSIEATYVATATADNADDDDD